MKKYIFYLIIGLVSLCCFGSVRNLETKAFDSYFNVVKWSINKELFKKDLSANKINDEIVFSNRTFNGLDFTELDFRNRKFSKCIFKGVNFNRSDLRDTVFDEDCRFKKSYLSGALLYGFGDLGEESTWIKGYKFPEYKNSSDLLNSYSTFRELVKLGKEMSVYSEYCKCLNKFFPGLELDLTECDLSGLNLTGIDLRNASLDSANLKGSDLSHANLQYTDLVCADLRGSKLIGCDFRNSCLTNARFQRAWLTDLVQVPNYPEKNRTRLFKKWIKSTPEEENFYQMLVNGEFDLVRGVDPVLIRQGIQVKRNLRKADLENTQLENINLSFADLQEANLMHANLKNTDLSYANLQNINLQNTDLSGADLQYTDLRNLNLEGSTLKGAKLGGARLSDTLYLPENCKDEGLYRIYKSCNSAKTKSIMKEIIIAKGLY